MTRPAGPTPGFRESIRQECALFAGHLQSKRDWTPFRWRDDEPQPEDSPHAVDHQL
jgi:hypothetical protein